MSERQLILNKSEIIPVPEPSYYFGADSDSPGILRAHSVSSDLPRQMDGSLAALPLSQQTASPSVEGQPSSDHSGSQPLVILVSSNHSAASNAQVAAPSEPSEPLPEVEPEPQAVPADQPIAQSPEESFYV